jgi:hypothetical protein
VIEPTRETQVSASSCCYNPPPGCGPKRTPQGRIVQKTHYAKDASSKGRNVQAFFQGQIGIGDTSSQHSHSMGTCHFQIPTYIYTPCLHRLLKMCRRQRASFDRKLLGEDPSPHPRLPGIGIAGYQTFVRGPTPPAPPPHTTRYISLFFFLLYCTIQNTYSIVILWRIVLYYYVLLLLLYVSR